MLHTHQCETPSKSCFWKLSLHKTDWEIWMRLCCSVLTRKRWFMHHQSSVCHTEKRLSTLTVLWHLQTVWAVVTPYRFLPCLKLTLYYQVFTSTWKDLSSHITHADLKISFDNDSEWYVQLLLMQNYQLHPFNSTFTKRKLSGRNRKKNISLDTRAWGGAVQDNQYEPLQCTITQEDAAFSYSPAPNGMYANFSPAAGLSWR